MPYAEDRLWFDKYIEAAKVIIGPHLLCVSSFEIDTTQAADLVVFTAKNVTIACRLRREGYAGRYPWDVTIRAKRDSGAKTELSKITDGWGDWFFYGHVEGEVIGRWFLVDLTKFRAKLIRGKERLKLKMIPNSDGTHFVSLDVRNCPDVVLASSHEVPA
ncbi:hypothetical protein LCGC14_0354720 [marine sediment metagenome]|uniref:Uncharacterized protein n=1 Tax=marine sediment metagenome TaxID=412755 RepID=A0A0F9TSH6_9ZZZZ